MKSTIILAAVVCMALAGTCLAGEQYPEQEATVTITVTKTDGTIVSKDALTESTEGADTTKQYKELQQAAHTDAKPVKPAKKKSTK